MNRCPICGGPLKVLWTTWYCPKECDRKKKDPPKAHTDDDDCAEASGSAGNCPQCNSSNIDPFGPPPGWSGAWTFNYHCWSCGDCWT